MPDVVVLSKYRTKGSGHALAMALGGRCITPLNTRPIDPDAVIINFGVSRPLEFLARHPGKVINSSAAVGRAVNKMRFFRLAADLGLPTPTFTTCAHEAYRWNQDGVSPHHRVYARSLVTSSQGRGITVFEPECMEATDVVSNQFKFFTYNYPKTKEFRVHVVDGRAVHVAQKRRMSEEALAERGIAKVDTRIRSYKRGWVFANELTIDETKLPIIEGLAVDAAHICGLDYCAVDVLAKGQGPNITGAAVCEVNTAPSLAGETTLRQVTNAIAGVL